MRSVYVRTMDTNNFVASVPIHALERLLSFLQTVSSIFTMMKSAILSLLVATASAFAPASQVRVKSGTHLFFPISRRVLSGSEIQNFDHSPLLYQSVLSSLFSFSVPTGFCCSERRRILQVYPFLGPPRKVRWIFAWRYGIRPHASVSYALAYSSSRLHTVACIL